MPMSLCNSVKKETLLVAMRSAPDWQLAPAFAATQKAAKTDKKPVLRVG